MKSFVSFFAICMVATSAVALTPAGQGRRAMSAQMGAPRATASTNQLAAMASMSVSASNPTASVNINKPSVRVEDTTATVPAPVDKREKEKAACLGNNIGIGNTFVWASRYSNVANYASMVEDVDNPENNTCFVKVGLKSDDSRINVADIPTQYYEMGRDITCGAWANEDMLRQRILDAKKKGRTWGTVAGAVGGAGLGVGIMELFGNAAIGGKVEGQKALDEKARLRSQLLALKKEGTQEYKSFMGHLKTFAKECDSEIWNEAGAQKPEECGKLDYKALLEIDKASI